MKKKDGKSFEKLATNVFRLLSKNEKFTSVEHDVTIQSEDGPLQFDVVIKSKVGSLNLLTVVECRDYPKKNIDRTHVDGLHSKMIDAKANKAVLVARKGFSAGAKKKAKRLGITLCTAHDMEGGLDNIGIDIPVIVYSIDVIQAKIRIKFHSTADTAIDENTFQELYLSGLPIGEAFNSALKNHEIPIDPLNEWREWTPNNQDTIHIPTEDAEIILEELKVGYELIGSYYFGYVSELPGTIALNNLSQDEVNIFFRKEEVMDYRNIFTSYRKYSEIPVVNSVPIAVILSPEINFIW